MSAEEYPGPRGVAAPPGSNYFVRGSLREDQDVILPTDTGVEWIVATRKEAGALGDLASIRSDLNRAQGLVVRLARDLNALGRPMSIDPDIADDLGARYAGAVGAYARCFRSGVRNHLDTGYLAGDDDALADHGYFLDLRNKHHAHSVSRMERMTVCIGVPQPGGPGLWRLYEVTTAHQLDMSRWLVKLSRLIDLALQEVTRSVDVEYTRLRDYVEARQPDDFRRRARITSVAQSGRDLSDRPHGPQAAGSSRGPR